MSGVARYILRLSAAAVLTAVAQSFPLEGSMRGLVKLVSGVFMAMTLISPLLTLRLPDMDGWLSSFDGESSAVVSSGEEMAREAMDTIIKERTEAYILDKAAALDAVVTVRVRTDSEGIPVSVTLRGDVSGEVKAQLSRIITSELGIGKEAQQWIS